MRRVMRVANGMLKRCRCLLIRLADIAAAVGYCGKCDACIRLFLAAVKTELQMMHLDSFIDAHGLIPS
jgi:hypothetical protein